MDDTERQLLSQYAWNAYKLMPTTFQPQVESCLLMQLVEQSQGTLNQDYADWNACAKLLSSENSVKELFLECWELGSFVKLRKLEILQPLSGRISNATTIIHYGSTFTEVHGDSYSYNSHSESRRQIIIKWLSEFDYGPIQKDTYSKRAEGTSEWFLGSPSFEQWLNTGSKRILWCPGMPGVGKTVISSLVVHHLENLRKVPVCVTYLNYKRHSQQSLHHILSTILRQLYELYEPAMDVIEDFYRLRSSRSHPTDTDLINTVIAAAGAADNLWLVIDGLDEYLDVYSDNEIVILRDALMSIPNLKLMVTSRVIGNMPRIFESDHSVQQEIASLEADIQLYIDSQIETKIPKKYHRDLKAKIQEHVIRAAKQRFLLVKLHMDLITSRLTLGEMRDALDTLTEEIDQVYRQALERIDQQGERHQRLAYSILMWITCTYRHLTVKELQHALAAAPDRERIQDYLYPEDLLTSVCAGLVVINIETGVVQLVHHTAQEFFESTRRIYFPDAESRIVESCSSYLSMNPAAYDRPPSQVFTLLDYLPFYRYMADFLDLHLRSSGHNLIDPSHEELGRGIGLLLSIRCAEGHYPLWRWRQVRWKPIHFAAAMNLISLLDKLLEMNPADVNTCEGQTGFTPIICAVRVAAKEMIKHLIALDRVNRNDSDAEGNSLLTIAVRHGHKDIMDILLSTSGVDANFQNRIGRTPLHEAVIYNRWPAFETLIGYRGIDVNAHDQESETPIFHAIRYGQVDMMGILLQDPRVDVSSVNKHGRDPLALAVAEGAEAMVRMLLQRSAFAMDFCDKSGQTYLSMAAQNGMTEIVQELLAFPDCPIDVPDNEGGTPLFWASNHGHIEVVRLLLSTGQVNPDFPDVDGWTPLYCAARSNHLDILEALLETGQVDPDYPNNEGTTPLSFAAGGGYMSIVQRLLRESVDVNSRDHRDSSYGGRTPLCHAATSGHESMVRLLLRNGAHVEAKDDEGRTPLCSVARNWMDRPEIAKILLEAGADIEARDNEGRTPLIATTAGPGMQQNPRTVEFLLNRGACVDAKDHHGRNALWYATGRWYRDNITVLTERTVDRECRDTDGWTILIHAASYGSPRNVEFLLSTGVDVNAQDNHGRTALHYAASQGIFEGKKDMKGSQGSSYEKVASALLHAGTHVNVVDEDGRTPLDYAKRKEMAKILMQHGGVKSDLPPLNLWKWFKIEDIQ